MSRGFSLVEMAVVLVIVVLLLGGLLVPLETQVAERKVGETEKALEGIKEALSGFAFSNGRLPRPAVSFSDGTERSACSTEANCSGFVPWVTLGVPKLDPWGKIFRYSVTPDYAGGTSGNTSFLLTTNASKKIQTRSGGPLVWVAGSADTCSSLKPCAPVVIFSHGPKNWGVGDTDNAFADDTGPPHTNLDEDANNDAIATGTAVFITRTATDNRGASGGEFDDIVAWISPHILFNRMIAAGKLP